MQIYLHLFLFCMKIITSNFLGDIKLIRFHYIITRYKGGSTLRAAAEWLPCLCVLVSMSTIRTFFNGSRYRFGEYLMAFTTDVLTITPTHQMKPCSPRYWCSPSALWTTIRIKRSHNFALLFEIRCKINNYLCKNAAQAKKFLSKNAFFCENYLFLRFFTIQIHVFFAKLFEFICQGLRL